MVFVLLNSAWHGKYLFGDDVDDDGGGGDVSANEP